MKNYKRSFDADMRSILRNLIDGSFHIPSPDSPLSECLFECIELSYVRGIEFFRDANGGLHFTAIKPTVTRKGREFLDERSPNFRANLAIGISIAALLIPLLAYLRDICDTIQWLFSLMN